MTTLLLLASAAVADDRLRSLRDILDDDSFQTSWLPSGADSQAWPYTVPWLGKILLIMFLLVVAFALGTIVLHAMNERRVQRAGGEPAGPADDGAESPAPSRAEVDAFAAAGRYSEAIHALFLLVVDAVRASARGTLLDSLTGREVVRVARLPDLERAAFATIARQVERTVFGSIDAGEREFRSCDEAASAVLSALREAPRKSA